jgi:hypothetical protein
MYVYLAPQGGINDILCVIDKTIQYCIATRRTLLLDTTKSCYGINFSDYFYLKNIPISLITDTHAIQKIISDEMLTIYPEFITDRNLNNWKITRVSYGVFSLNNNVLTGLPSSHRNENIVIHSNGGGGPGIIQFKNLYFNQNIIDHVKHEFKKLPAKYLCIQIRNTDYKCDYRSLYETNKDLIHSYNTIYIATDDKESLTFFRDKKLNIVNFTEFPDTTTINLHYSSVSGDSKIKNVICDIYIISMADRLLSNSEGGFIKLAENIRSDKSIIISKFT